MSQALKWLSIRVWFLDFFLSLLLSFLFKYDTNTELFLMVYTHFPLYDFTHTHTSNYSIFWRGTWRIRFASASLSCLAVISYVSFLLNVCINSCYVCIFAPMPCATLMESAMHCMRTQLATRAHTPTNTVVFFLECLTISWLFHHLYVS